MIGAAEDKSTVTTEGGTKKGGIRGRHTYKTKK